MSTWEHDHATGTHLHDYPNVLELLDRAAVVDPKHLSAADRVVPVAAGCHRSGLPGSSRISVRFLKPLGHTFMHISRPKEIEAPQQHSVAALAQPLLGLASGDDPATYLDIITDYWCARESSTFYSLSARRYLPPFAAREAKYGCGHACLLCP